MPDRCLGKRAPRHDPRVLPLARLLRTAALPPVPKSCDWTQGVPSWPMMGNDRLGDCTAAAVGHAIQSWTTKAQSPIILTDDQVVDLYCATSGYVRGQPETDQGAICADVLAYMDSKGIWQNQQRLEILSGYARAPLGNTLAARAAIYWLGGIYIGLDLPLSAQEQDVWEVATTGQPEQTDPGTWGGHCVWICGYDEAGLTCITWGAVQRMTWTFWLTYCDEAYVLVSRDWLNTNGVSPDGLDFGALEERMQAIRNGG